MTPPMRLKSLVIACVAIAAGSITVTGPSAAQDVSRVPSPAAIDEQVKALNLPQRTVELTSEKAARFRHLIEQGQYTDARALIGQALEGSNIRNWRFYPFSDFIAQATNLTDPSFKNRLDTWVAQDERDPLPILVRAQYDYDLAWLQRGHQFSRYVEASHVASFQDSIEKALHDVDTALELSDANPYAFSLKLRILQSAGASPKLLETFRQAVAKYPKYYPLYDIVLHR
jgi:tetratricopeptide (TPR) repeat protein